MYHPVINRQNLYTAWDALRSYGDDVRRNGDPDFPMSAGMVGSAAAFPLAYAGSRMLAQRGEQWLRNVRAAAGAMQNIPGFGPAARSILNEGKREVPYPRMLPRLPAPARFRGVTTGPQPRRPRRRGRGIYYRRESRCLATLNVAGM